MDSLILNGFIAHSYIWFMEAAFNALLYDFIWQAPCCNQETGVINFTPKRTYCACTSWVYIINGECLDTRQSFTCLISTLYPTHTSHWFRSRSITSESWEIQGYNIQWSTEYCQLHRRLSGQTPTAAYSHCISHFYTWRPYFYIWFLFFSHPSTLVQLPRTCGFHIDVPVLSQSHPTFPFIQSSTLVPLRPTHSHWPPNQKLNSVPPVVESALRSTAHCFCVAIHWTTPTKCATTNRQYMLQLQDPSLPQDVPWWMDTATLVLNPAANATQSQ